MVEKLTKRKTNRINITDAKSYDLALSFLTGNPTPKRSKDDLVNEATTMYEEMSPETGEFWNYMVNNNLLDLEAKKGKMGGGYCTFFPNYSSPFIFANFNGTSGDLDVLTYEAGHAFQVCSSKDKIPSYRWPTFEASELHSMSMEFLAYGEDSFLDKGTYWHRQGHSFGDPFYYIDYTLAQVVSFQYWVKGQANHKVALEEYTDLCSLGGSQSFVSLLESAKKENPFINGRVKKTIEPIEHI